MIEYAGRTYTENDSIKFYRLSEEKIYLKLQNNLYEFTGKMIELSRKLLDNEVYHISNEYDVIMKLLLEKNLISERHFLKYELNDYSYLMEYKGYKYIVNLSQGEIYQLTSSIYNILLNGCVSRLNKNDLFELRIRDIITPMQESNVKDINVNTYNKRVYLINSFRCNMNCIYCFEHNKTFDIMPNDIKHQTIEYIKKLSEQNFITLVFYGGEPLLEENYAFIEDFLKLHLNNVEYEFITNGLGIDNYFSLLSKYRHQISCFTITLDGPKKIHDKRRIFRNGSFELIINNVKMLVENEFYVKLRVNLDYDNIAYLSELCEEIENKLKNYTKFFKLELHLVSCKDNSEFKQIRLIDLLQSLLKLKEYSFKITIADQFLRRIRNSFDVYVSNFMQTDFCNYYDNIVINNNGDIYHCNEAMGTNEFVIANLKDSDVYNKVNLVKEQTKKICNGCPFDIICKGKCKFENYTKNGSIDKVTCNKEEMLEVIKYLIDNGDYERLQE
ncbi:radical SAM/SPASM domain-containing protein [Dielma fastidiosa]|uniref:Radical SAM protein with 4Fe4S-binding SPASM domain n=1 Tax=Dielma fastidiosa TaxID=1034346 RepID=A0A318L4V2_9FIRM|nr:radical SAM protein [Dielma fastidiosa]PXX76196.1 radical SAM protein with 4Fe4S-binding SPASM domain [Dielma fastidiosa]